MWIQTSWFGSLLVNRGCAQWAGEDRCQPDNTGSIIRASHKLRNYVFPARLWGFVTVFTKIFLVEDNVMNGTQKNPFHGFQTISRWVEVPQGPMSGKEGKRKVPTPFIFLLLHQPQYFTLTRGLTSDSVLLRKKKKLKNTSFFFF